MELEKVRLGWEIIGGISFVASLAVGWFIKLEVGKAALKMKIEGIELRLKQHAEKENAIWIKFDSMQNSMTEIMQGLARIEGKLENKN